MKLAKWRSDPIDGMNNYGIKIVDNTLRCFRIYEGKAFGDIALMVIRKFEKKFYVKFECCVLYTFEVYNLFFMYE